MFVCSSSGPSLYFGDASKVGSRPTVRRASPVVCHVETNVGVSPKLDALGVHIKRRKDKLEELAFSQFAPFSSLVAWCLWLPALRRSRS